MDDEHLSDAIAPFVERKLVADVIGEVKSGKEATVFCCRGGARAPAPLLAAKVYRPIEERGFRNDAIYREGRVVLDSRAGRAMASKTRKGKEFQYGTWINAEWETLRSVHRAGANVPKPLAYSGAAILMSYIGDEDGVAPPLARAPVTPESAPRLFQTVMDNIERFLACNRVHGDLSPYNILYFKRRLTIIDFPQAVDPRFNPNAFDLLHRDIDNVYRFFARHGVIAEPFRLADQLWRRFIDADL